MIKPALKIALIGALVLMLRKSSKTPSPSVQQPKEPSMDKGH